MGAGAAGGLPTAVRHVRCRRRWGAGSGGRCASEARLLVTGCRDGTLGKCRATWGAFRVGVSYFRLKTKGTGTRVTLARSHTK
eukprot:2618736-Prymnesium_polylepis.1